MRLAYLSLIALSAACGGGGGSVPPGELAAELAEASCSQYAACCTTEEFAEVTFDAADEAECRTFYAGLLDTLLIPVLEDSIAAGRVVYHGDRMADCIDALRSLSCAETAAGIEVSGLGGCEDPFEPQVATAGTCANDWDCISGYCAGGSTDFEGNITYGACEDTRPLAALCDDDDECAAGLYCDRSDGPANCQPKLDDGAACGDDDDCASDACVELVCGVETACDGVD